MPSAPLPSTSLASAVEVNGVVQLDGKVRVIVKAPAESTSRSVTDGDYLSNGQVLVKRIELRDGREPVVILDQNGVEVINLLAALPLRWLVRPK